MSRDLVGYARITFRCVAFSPGVPLALIPVGPDNAEMRARGEAGVNLLGPDRVMRPVFVDLELQRCDTCRALIEDEDANAHTAWHAGLVMRQAMPMFVLAGVVILVGLLAYWSGSH